MNVEKDEALYDVFEFDIYDLKQKVQRLDLKEILVYGVGLNGEFAYRLLKGLGVKIKYFVDLKAPECIDHYQNIRVLSPDQLIERYAGEYIVLTPSIYEGILRWMLAKGIPEDKILLSFYRMESVRIDYGNRYGSKPSAGLVFRAEKSAAPKVTFVTIAYNTPERFLRRAVESVLRQTMPEWKYLFIINGATDATSEIIGQYAALDARISVIDLKRNLPWTDVVLLSTIRNNIEGDYCCQLDSDDYYDETFLEEAVRIGERNQADIVCTRTCLFSSDSSYNPAETGFEYDRHDKFYFNVVHPRSHIIGYRRIMVSYAKSEICSTFWGKLYANSLMERYLAYLLELTDDEREFYYRLDIAMTYRILSMATRVFYSDKVLHFAQYSSKSSTYTLAPIEWLMSLWYAYKGIREDMFLSCEEKKAWKCSKKFLRTHLIWMAQRKGLLMASQDWKNRDKIMAHFREMAADPIFKEALLGKRDFTNNDCREFYNSIKKIVGEGECNDV